MMVGDTIALNEAVVSSGSFGAEFLAKGTTGTVTEIADELVEIRTKHDTFLVPVVSTTPVGKKAA